MHGLQVLPNRQDCLNDAVRPSSGVYLATLAWSQLQLLYTVLELLLFEPAVTNCTPPFLFLPSGQVASG